ncbi:MAG TPA: RNA methyltransferase [Cytophagaceae bacterium]
MKKLKLDELNRLSNEEFKNAQKNSIVIILDNVRSMHNVGSVFRTADAFLVDKIYLCGITGIPPHKEINKTALGANETVAWEYAPTTLDLVNAKKAEGYQIICLEHTSDSIPIQKFIPQKDQKYALVFGNEVFGISDEVIGKAHMCVEIPQFGTKHSLNISVAAGIVIWDFVAKSQITP